MTALKICCCSIAKLCLTLCDSMKCNMPHFPVLHYQINPEYSLERLMLKLKLQYFGHLLLTADSLEETLILGKIESRKKRGQRLERMRWFDGITKSIDMGLSKLQEIVKDREAWHAAVHGVTKNQTLSD